MKQCIGCREHKQDNAFYASGSTDDGLNRYCKNCCKVNRALESVRRRDRKSKISHRQWDRATRAGLVADKSITLAKLFKRDTGTCAACNDWVKPRYASIDHIHPLSRGGAHTWANVQLMHLKCNLRKSNKIPT